MILNSGHEANEKEHPTLLKVDSEDTETIHSFVSLEVPFIDIHPRKAFSEEPRDSKMYLGTTRCNEIYSSLSLSLSITISADLLPNKEELCLHVSGKHEIRIGGCMFNFHDVFCSFAPTYSIIISAGLPLDKK